VQSLVLRSELRPSLDSAPTSIEAKQRVLEARAASALVDDGPVMAVVRVGWGFIPL
jgi:hypothetical protein